MVGINCEITGRGDDCSLKMRFKSQAITFDWAREIQLIHKHQSQQRNLGRRHLTLDTKCPLLWAGTRYYSYESNDGTFAYIFSPGGSLLFVKGTAQNKKHDQQQLKAEENRKRPSPLSPTHGIRNPLSSTYLTERYGHLPMPRNDDDKWKYRCSGASLNSVLVA